MGEGIYFECEHFFEDRKATTDDSGDQVKFSCEIFKDGWCKLSNCMIMKLEERIHQLEQKENWREMNYDPD